MLFPKKTKFKKSQKNFNSGIATAGHNIAYGDFCLKSKTQGYLSSRQIESARRVIVRYTRKTGKLWIRVFPDKPVTKKPLEVRQGSGKGSVDHYVAPVYPGTVLYEVNGVSTGVAQEALTQAAYKLPVKCIFERRNKIGAL